MNVEFRAPEHKHPLVFKTKSTKAEWEAVVPTDVDPAKIDRKFELSPQPLDDTGQLYFEIVDKGSAKLFWLHVCQPGYLLEVKYPSGNKIDKPAKDVVTVYRMEDKVVFDVDGLQYSFLSKETADPFIKDMEDLKEMAAALAKDLMNRPDEPTLKPLPSA